MLRCLDAAVQGKRQAVSHQGDKLDLEAIFNQVFQRDYPVLVRVAANVTGDLQVAEELCQEAMLKYYQRLACLPHGIAARYWLLRVVRNLALNYAKSRQRESKANRNHYYSYHRESVNAGEKRMLKTDTAEMVRKAVLLLPEKLRAVIVLKEYGQLNYADIAQALDISVENVKVRVFRARAKLALLLDRESVDVS